MTKIKPKRFSKRSMDYIKKLRRDMMKSSEVRVSCHHWEQIRDHIDYMDIENDALKKMLGKKLVGEALAEAGIECVIGKEQADD